MGNLSTSTHSYTIQETSKLTGLPESTLRYYESVGIIEPVDRAASSKHRMYSEANLNVLDAIACLNATGLSLNDIKTYMQNREKGALAANDQVMLLKRQELRLKKEEESIKIREEYVNLKIAYWRAIEAGSEVESQKIAGDARQLTLRLKEIRK